MNFTVLGDYNNQITEEDGDYFVNICIPENEYDMDDIIEIFEKFNCFDESQILCGKTGGKKIRQITLLFTKRYDAESFVNTYGKKKIFFCVCDKEIYTHYKKELIENNYIPFHYNEDKGIKSLISQLRQSEVFLLYKEQNEIYTRKEMLLIGIAIGENIPIKCLTDDIPVYLTGIIKRIQSIKDLK